MRLPGYCDLKRFVIFIAASFTASHREFLLSVSEFIVLLKCSFWMREPHHTHDDRCDSPTVPRYLPGKILRNDYAKNTSDLYSTRGAINL
jgi:hypothetical protein